MMNIDPRYWSEDFGLGRAFAIVQLQEAGDRAARLARQFQEDCTRYAHAERTVMPDARWDDARTSLHDGYERFARYAIDWQARAQACYFAAMLLRDVYDPSTKPAFAHS